MTGVPVPADDDRTLAPGPDGGTQLPAPVRAKPQVSDPARGWALGVAAAWAVLFCLACVLPSLRFYVQPDPTCCLVPPSPYYYNAWGLWLLSLGWAAPFVLQFGWLANPLGAAAVVAQLIGRKGPRLAAVILSASALLVAVDTLTLFGRHIPVGVDYPDSYQLIRPLPGFYVWLASLAVPMAGAVVALLRYGHSQGPADATAS